MWDDDLIEHLVNQWRRDAATFAGAKTARRIIGFAKVSDIQSLPDDQRVVAARYALRGARALLVHAPSAADIAEAAGLVSDAWEEADGE